MQNSCDFLVKRTEDKENAFAFHQQISLFKTFQLKGQIKVIKKGSSVGFHSQVLRWARKYVSVHKKQ